MSNGRGRPLLLIVLVVVLLPVIYSVFATGVGIAYLSLPILACAAISWFIWRVFLRVYLRATRIAHIRERRLLMEASMR
jgi:hypothetical protein